MFQPTGKDKKITRGNSNSTGCDLCFCEQFINFLTLNKKLIMSFLIMTDDARKTIIPLFQKE